MSTEVRLGPATATLHLEYNAGEDVTVEVTVVDDSRPPVPVPITGAVGTVAFPGCSNGLHEWSVAAGNLVLLDQGTSPGGVRLHATSEQTRAWARAWGDAEWQLDVVDLFARSKVACRGDIRVNPSLRTEEVT